MSPLEQKQIQIQAKADALFDAASGDARTVTEKPAKKRKAPKDNARTGRAEADEDTVKIESLNFKVSRPKHRYFRPTFPF